MKQLPLFPNACLITGFLFLFSLTSCASLPSADSQPEASASASESTVSADESEVSQTDLIQTKAVQTEPNATETDETEADETEPDEIETNETASPEADALVFEKYRPDELAAIDEGGCGMTLLEPGTDYWQDGAYFFRGFSDDGSSAPAYVKLSGELVPFDLTSASGEAFYGQQTMQTFESEDGTMTLEASVTLGALGEIESVEIADGTLTLKSQGQRKTVSVAGDAGC